MITHTRWVLLPKLLAPEDERGLVGPGNVSCEPVADEHQSPERLRERHDIEQVIRDLSSVPGAMARLIDGLDDEALAQPAQDGGWGVVEIIPHFRDWERIYVDRVELSVKEDPAVLEEYDDSLWAIERGYRDLDPREVLAEFTALREQLVARVSGLEPAQLQRIVVLPKHGPRTLLALLQNLTEHDAKHLMQARDVLA